MIRSRNTQNTPTSTSQPASLVTLALVSHPDVFRRVLENCDYATLSACVRSPRAVFDIAGSILYRNVESFRVGFTGPRLHPIPTQHSIGYIHEYRRRIRDAISLRNLADCVKTEVGRQPHDGILRVARKRHTSALKKRLLQYCRRLTTDEYLLSDLQKTHPPSEVFSSLDTIVLSGEWGKLYESDSAESGDREGIYYSDASSPDSYTIPSSFLPRLQLGPPVVDNTHPRWPVKRIVRTDVSRMGQCITRIERMLDSGGEAIFRLGEMQAVDVYKKRNPYDWDAKVPSFSDRVTTTTLVFFTKAHLQDWYIPLYDPEEEEGPRNCTVSIELFVGTIITHILLSRAVIRLVNVACFDPVWLGLAIDSTPTEVATHVEGLIRKRIDEVIRLKKLKGEQASALHDRLESYSLLEYIMQDNYDGVFTVEEAKEIRETEV
jgi:hypothetical protein